MVLVPTAHLRNIFLVKVFLGLFPFLLFLIFGLSPVEDDIADSAGEGFACLGMLVMMLVIYYTNYLWVVGRTSEASITVGGILAMVMVLFMWSLEIPFIVKVVSAVALAMLLFLIIIVIRQMDRERPRSPVEGPRVPPELRFYR